MKTALKAAMLLGATTLAAPAMAFNASGGYSVHFIIDGGGTGNTICATLASNGAAGAYRDYGTISIPDYGLSGTYAVYKRTFYGVVNSGGEFLSFTGTLNGGKIGTTLFTDEFYPPATIEDTGSFTATKTPSCKGAQPNTQTRTPVSRAQG